MRLPLDVTLALPELILAGSAMILLAWGAFAKKTGPVFVLAAVVGLAAAAFTAATGQEGRAFGGALIADNWAGFSKVAIFAASAVSIVL